MGIFHLGFGLFNRSSRGGHWLMCTSPQVTVNEHELKHISHDILLGHHVLLIHHRSNVGSRVGPQVHILDHRGTPRCRPSLSYVYLTKN